MHHCHFLPEAKGSDLYKLMRGPLHNVIHQILPLNLAFQRIWFFYLFKPLGVARFHTKYKILVVLEKIVNVWTINTIFTSGDLNMLRTKTIRTNLIECNPRIKSVMFHLNTSVKDVVWIKSFRQCSTNSLWCTKKDITCNPKSKFTCELDPNLNST